MLPPKLDEPPEDEDEPEEDELDDDEPLLEPELPDEPLEPELPEEPLEPLLPPEPPSPSTCRILMPSMRSIGLTDSRMMPSAFSTNRMRSADLPHEALPAAGVMHTRPAPRTRAPHNRALAAATERGASCAGAGQCRRLPHHPGFTQRYLIITIGFRCSRCFRSGHFAPVQTFVLQHYHRVRIEEGRFHQALHIGCIRWIHDLDPFNTEQC